MKDWGDFNVAQAVAVDDTRIYVADRENARIQIYAHDGKLVESRVSPAGNHTYSMKPLGGGRLLAVAGRDGAAEGQHGQALAGSMARARRMGQKASSAPSAPAM